MKIKWDDKYATISLYAVGVVVISGILLAALRSFPDVNNIFVFIGTVISPIIWGLVIGYLLNPGVKFFELKVFKKWQSPKRKRLIRTISITIVVIISLIAIAGFCILVVPQLAKSIMKIFDKMPIYFKQLQEWAAETFSGSPELLAIINDPLAKLQTYLNDLWVTLQPQLTSVISDVGNGILRFVVGFKDFIIGFIIAIYLISARDMFKVQIKKFLFAFVKNSKCQKLLFYYRKANHIFRHFVMGILIDSIIVGIIVFIFCMVFKMPFPMLLAVIIGITNVIPFFGPFIGAIPCGLIVLMEDPVQAFWFAVFMLILQQFDGNVLYPYILGDRTGVPAVWVLLSIIVGGGLFGFVGMVLAVPVFAVIYMLCKEYVEFRLKKKSLPTMSMVYEKDVTHFTNEYVYTEEQQKEDTDKYDKLFPKKLNIPKKLPKLKKGGKK